MGEHEILTVKEVAELLRTSEQNVRRLADRGDLPGTRIGKRWRFNRQAIESLVPSPRTQQGAA